MDGAIDSKRKPATPVDEHGVCLPIGIESQTSGAVVAALLDEADAGFQRSLEKTDGMIEDLSSPIDRRPFTEPSHSRVRGDVVRDDVIAESLALRSHVSSGEPGFAS